MGKSLQDQLLNIGVASKTQAKKVKTDQRKQKKQQQKNKVVRVNEEKLSVQQAAIAKAEKDRRLNQQQKQQAEQKSIAAQVKQLIDNNKMLQGDEDIAYHFVEDNKVKTVYVNEEIKALLGKGRLAIVKDGKKYQVITSEIAEKILLRNEKIVFKQTESKPTALENDPYADYQIPDDLMW